jgi:hypothetical protein
MVNVLGFLHYISMSWLLRSFLLGFHKYMYFHYLNSDPIYAINGEQRLLNKVWTFRLIGENNKTSTLPAITFNRHSICIHVYTIANLFCMKVFLEGKSLRDAMRSLFLAKYINNSRFIEDLSRDISYVR